jgi:hypothetical protein
VVSYPTGNISDEIKRLLRSKKEGALITVPDYSVSSMVNYGFCKPLRPEEIENMTMKFSDGYVYLACDLGTFRITTTSKSKNQAPTQSKVRINVK